MLYATEFMYANGARVLKDGKVTINSREAVDGLECYLALVRKHGVTPPSVAVPFTVWMLVGYFESIPRDPGR